MYVSAFGIAFSRNRTQLFARPHRIHRDIPVDHLPPPRVVIDMPRGGLQSTRRYDARRRF